MAPASPSGWFVVAGELVTAKVGGGILDVEHYSGNDYVNVLRATKFATPLAWGPYTTEADAEAEKAKLDAKPPKDVQTVPKSDPALLPGLDTIGDFFHRLTEAATWERVAEAVAGGLLIYVALKAMFPGTVNTVTSAAKNGAKAAAFL
jgi:hypothetical protein